MLEAHFCSVDVGFLGQLRRPTSMQELSGPGLNSNVESEMLICACQFSSFRGALQASLLCARKKVKAVEMKAFGEQVSFRTLAPFSCGGLFQTSFQAELLALPCHGTVKPLSR